MRITNNIIKAVVDEVAGQDVVPLVMKLKNRKNVSEFKLAENIEEEINATRNKLYRLFENNLVHFTRKKDRKKGWYVYYWTFNLKQVKFLHYSLKKQRLEKLKERLKREKSEQFYLCNDKCIRLDFDQAINFNFKCPECGHLVELQDNKEEVKMIEKEIKELESTFKKRKK